MFEIVSVSTEYQNGGVEEHTGLLVYGVSTLWFIAVINWALGFILEVAGRTSAESYFSAVRFFIVLAWGCEFLLWLQRRWDARKSRPKK